MECEELKRIADRIRAYALWAIYSAGSGHPGGSLSCADILAVLYFKELRIDPSRPSWPQRDRLVLSKGHSCPALYAALALRGFFPIKQLATLRRADSSLQGHPDPRCTAGIESTAGSLGQGLSISLGMALAARLRRSSYRSFCLLGDGDMQEGQTWEAASLASHYNTSNLIAIVDYNKLQGEGGVSDVHSVEPLAERWRAFGWQPIEVDGHDIPSLLDTFDQIGKGNIGPTAIIAHTTKGKGVSFMENKPEWHGSRGLTAEEFSAATRELGMAHEFELAL